MAKLSGGILGPFFGKIGSIIGSRWKNINYIKSRPEKKRKKTKRSPGQIANEMKFRHIQQSLVPFYPYLMVGFSKLAVDKTEFNAAYSANYKLAYLGEWPNITLDHSKLKISSGKLSGLLHPVIERSGAAKLDLSWEQTAERNVSFDDQLMLVVYCPHLEMTDGFIGGVKRKALECTFNFDVEMAGHAVEVYLSVTSSDRKSISDSIYLGRLEA